MTFDRHPQTLVVKRNWDRPTEAIEDYSAYETVDFCDLFESEGLPDLHNAGSEDEVLEWLSGEGL